MVWLRSFGDRDFPKVSAVSCLRLTGILYVVLKYPVYRNLPTKCEQHPSLTEHGLPALWDERSAVETFRVIKRRVKPLRAVIKLSSFKVSLNVE